MMRCKTCDYEWEYKGESYWATCPRCRKLNKVSDNESEDK